MEYDIASEINFHFFSQHKQTKLLELLGGGVICARNNDNIMGWAKYYETNRKALFRIFSNQFQLRE